jgi:hypothetical protein
MSRATERRGRQEAEHGDDRDEEDRLRLHARKRIAQLRFARAFGYS